MFGTSVEQGLQGLLHIRDRMKARFSQTPVRICFTSKIIRRVWQERAAEKGYRAANPEVPEDILNVQGPEDVISSYHREGIDSLVLQQVHIAPAGEDSKYYGLVEERVNSGTDNSTSAFNRVSVGRPALGTLGKTYPYREDIATVARSLEKDIALARQEQAALFYMGHGNKDHMTGKVYDELVREMRRQYPDILTVMSMVEGSIPFSEIIDDLRKHNVDKVVLKPFMMVAGDHVRKEMIGDGPGTLKTLLEDEGFVVFPVITGLGECVDFADIFVQHAADAARDAGIELR